MLLRALPIRSIDGRPLPLLTFDLALVLLPFRLHQSQELAVKHNGNLLEYSDISPPLKIAIYSPLPTKKCRLCPFVRLQPLLQDHRYPRLHEYEVQAFPKRLHQTFSAAREIATHQN